MECCALFDDSQQDNSPPCLSSHLRNLCMLSVTLERETKEGDPSGWLESPQKHRDPQVADRVGGGVRKAIMSRYGKDSPG